ncbi:MAG TPA: nitrogenase iron-molybdenum cofactor biosynthesis protein NifN [Azospirillaceae bacterium]|nr:nitrogenase iron-molybdenum cofactor biosynthesis protein NifN [Azospirillaceae bacterium]HRQ80496.1 nitrogenase iron-molybdenum cofactor biosynthesis protein NifN [Azospirillaceae bacterium]
MTHIPRVPTSAKSLATNPLKMSAPLGGALAFMGVDNCLPLFHGSQGCTAFGMVLLVRHFREAVPLQTTAMDQVATIMGGYENLEEALKTIHANNKPDMIGVCTTGVTETKGDDMGGALTLFRKRNPDLAALDLVFVNTPDFAGGFEEGFAAAVTGMVEQLVEPVDYKIPGQINVLAGAHLTPGDIEELRDVIESFGLSPIFLPDLSLSMSGRQPADFTATTLGGVTVDQIRSMGASEFTIAVGRSMGSACAALEMKTGVPCRHFDRLTGLEASDAFIKTLMEVSGRQPTGKIKRQRESLVDAMLDGHFFTSRKKIAVALEPDLLYAVTAFLNDLGADVVAAVSPTQAGILDKVHARVVMVGDHADVEALAKEAGAELVISCSHGRQGAQRLGIAHHRMGIPTFDRLGAGLKVSVGYRGALNLLLDVANIFLAAEMDHHGGPHDLHAPGHAHGQEGHDDAAGHACGGGGGGSCGCNAG